MALCFISIFFLRQTFTWDLGGKPITAADSIEVEVKDHEKIGRNRYVAQQSIGPGEFALLVPNPLNHNFITQGRFLNDWLWLRLQLGGF